MNNAQLKNLAKEQIKGNLLMLFLIAIIVVVINTAVVAIPVVGQVGIFFTTGILYLSQYRIFLDLATTNKKPQIEDLQYGMKFWKEATVLFLFQTIYITLWSLLFIIPGIIKGIAYSMSFYILAENPGMSGNDAITKSKELMNGHKMEFFMLSLSFIGWILLLVVSCGIASFYVVPYMNMAVTNFYLEIKGSDTYTQQ